MSISSWNNTLARWIIDNTSIRTTLHSASKSNYSMVFNLIKKGANLHEMVDAHKMTLNIYLVCNYTI